MKTSRYVLIGAIAFLCTGCLLESWTKMSPGKAENIKEETITAPDGTVTQRRTSSTAVTPAVSSKSAKDCRIGAAKLEPELTDSGGLNYKGFDLSAAANMRSLYVIGGICIVGGLLLGWLAGWGIGLTLAAGGFALIATARLFDMYPWVALFPVILCACAGVWVVWRLRQGKQNDTALKAVVEAIDELGTLMNPVRDKIVEKAGASKDVVKDAITRVKRKAGIA